MEDIDPPPKLHEVKMTTENDKDRSHNYSILKALINTTGEQPTVTVGTKPDWQILFDPDGRPTAVRGGVDGASVSVQGRDENLHNEYTMTAYKASIRDQEAAAAGLERERRGWRTRYVSRDGLPEDHRPGGYTENAISTWDPERHEAVYFVDSVQDVGRMQEEMRRNPQRVEALASSAKKQIDGNDSLDKVVAAHRKQPSLAPSR